MNNIQTNRSEATSHPFIIKIWLEETVEEAGKAIWRGHITHVPSGQRRYVQDLDGIVDFISTYLEAMGVRPGVLWRMRRRLRSRK